ncbi:MAG: SpoIIE family protein phosphatase [Deltaproteobacteria bacterium]|nr:SpoIIE family protein phosphatase [Deltaproteobacteria bacterium]
MTKLYVSSGLKEEAVFEIGGETTTLGRSPDNDIRIEDPSVSRRHARILRKDGGFFIEDLGSSNGTWVNGRLMTSGTEAKMREGLPVAIGNTILSLVRKPSIDDTTTQYSIDLMDCLPEAGGSASYRERFFADRKRLEVIQEVSTLLMQSLDAREICEKVLNSLFRWLEKIDSGIILWMDEGASEPREILARSKGKKSPGGVTYSRSVINRVLREGQAIMMADTDMGDRDDLSASIGLMHLRSVMCVPLMIKSRIRGVIYVHSVDMAQRFQKDDLLLFTALGTPAALAIENAVLYSKTRKAEAALQKAHDELEERVRQRTLELSDANERLQLEIAERRRAEEALAASREQEVEVAARIQKSLLLGSTPHEVQGIQVAALSVPSKGIDGDFYEFFVHSKTCLDLIVGDVMGKGIPAALLGAGTKSHFFRALTNLISVSHALPEPREILQRAHEMIVKELIALDSFVTLCYARFDLERRALDFVNCGHPRTIHSHRATGKCTTLEGRNMPLGFSEDEIYTQERVPFEPDDIFFFYSDAVTEAQNRSGEFFGEERLVVFLSQNAHLGPDDLIQKVLEAVISFSQSHTFADDLTCIAVKIPEDNSDKTVLRRELEITSDLDRLEEARSFARNLVQREITPPLDEEKAWMFQLAVNEAVVNIIKHAYDDRPGRRIRMEAEVFPDRISFTLRHWGKAFDRTSVRPPRFDGSEESGYGVFLIEECVDEVVYSQDEAEGNRISLIRYRERP